MAEIKRKDIIDDDALTAPLVLADNFEKAYASIQKLIAAGKEAGVDVQAATNTKQLREETEKLTAAQVELAKIEKQIATLVAKDNDEYRKQQKTIADLNITLKQKVALGSQDATQVNKTNASIKTLGAALNANRVAYAGLRNEQARNSKEGQALLKIIQEQDKDFKELQATIGKNQDNVGNYEGALKSLKIELKAAKDAVVGIAKELGTESAEFQQATARAGALRNEIDDLEKASKAVSGSQFENLGTEIGVVGDKIKALDFKGASSALKSFTANAKNFSFKELASGAKDFGKSLGGLGNVLKTHPIIFIAAIIIALVVAIVKLKDNVKFLTIAFNAVANVVEDVIQGFKDFADAIGLTNFADKKRSEAFLARMDKERSALKARYEEEKALLAARGKSTLTAEAAEQRAIQDKTQRIINELEKQRKYEISVGYRITDDKIKQLDERLAAEKQTLHDAEAEERLVFERRRNELIKFKDDFIKLEQQRQAAARDLSKLSVEQQIAQLQRIVDAEGNSYETRAKAAGDLFAKQKDLNKKTLDDKLAGFAAEEANVRRNFEDAFLAAKEIQTIQLNAAAARKESITELQALEEAAATKQRDLLLQNLNFEASVQQEIINDEHATYDERIQAAIDYDAKSKDILDVSLKGKLITEKKYNDELFNLTQQTTDTLVKLTQERIQKLADAAQDNQSTGTDNELTQLEKSLAAQEITYKQYLERRNKIQETQNDNSLNIQLKYLEQQYKALQEKGISSTALEANIAAVELQIAENRNAKLVEGEQLLQQRIQELKNTAFAAAQQIVEDQFAADDERRQAESDAIAKHLEIDLMLAGDNEEAKVKLKQDAEVKQQKIRQEQAAADRKRALFEKATAAISILINTAKGVGQALGTYPPPVSFVLAAVTAALGAVQLATVLSKPIPQYAMGTDNHPGGLAVVGDGGGVELIKEPGKRPYLSPATPTLVDLKPGTQVLSNEEYLASLALNNIRTTDRPGTAADSQLGSIDEGIKEMNRNMRKQHGMSADAVRELARYEANKQMSLKEFYA